MTDVGSDSAGNAPAPASEQGARSKPRPQRRGILRPRTRLGWWSLGLILLFGGLLGFFFVAVALGERGGEEFFDNLVLTLPMLVAWAAAAGSTVTGVVAIVAKRERGALVFASVLLGFLVTMFGVLEILFPH